MSVYTMSTIDPGVAAVPASAPAPGAGEVQQTGESLSVAMAALLNPTVIAQMANEFFSALPDSAAPPATTLPLGPPAPPATPPVDLGALPVAAAIPPASAFAPPTEATLRPLPATATGATGLSLPAAAEPTAPLGPYEFRPELVPGLLFASPPVSPPSAPSTSAAAAASPATPPVELDALPVAPAAPSTSTFASPAEAELGTLPATLGTTGLPPAVAVTEPTPVSAGSSFYFLEDIQSMPYTAPASPFEPYGFDSAMLPDLSLVAGAYDPRRGYKD